MKFSTFETRPIETDIAQVIPAELETEEDLGEVQAATGDILLLACR